MLYKIQQSNVGGKVFYTGCSELFIVILNTSNDNKK